jgi:hypothetical protein
LTWETAVAVTNLRSNDVVAALPKRFGPHRRTSSVNSTQRQECRLPNIDAMSEHR